jgi:hypothetical protein
MAEFIALPQWPVAEAEAEAEIESQGALIRTTGASTSLL